MSNDSVPQLSSLLKIESTRHLVECSSKQQALKFISELVAKQLNSELVAKRLNPSPQVIRSALQAREHIGSTGIGNGVALPHGKLKEGSSHIVCAFIHLTKPITFDANDNQPVDLLFALLAPPIQCKTYFNILSLVAKKLADRTVCHSLREAKSDQEFYQIIVQ